MKKVAAALIVGLLLVAGSGCSKKEQAPQTNPPASQSQLPPGHPSTGGNPSGQPAKPVDVKEVNEKVTKALDSKFPGEWSISGKTLKKGSYTENDNFKIADEVAAIYNGSMVSIFVGPDRISGTVKDQTGNRVLQGYAVPPTVDEVMKSGEPKVTAADSLGSTTYQKAFLPFKANGKTVAVMSISIAQ